MRSRNDRRSRAVLWGVGVLLAVALGLTGYAALLGSDETSFRPPVSGPPLPAPATTVSASVPVSTYSAPSAWAEPARWLAVPRGARAVGHHEVGFPHTEEGAIGMMVAASAIDAAGTSTLADQQLSVYSTYMVSTDQSATAEEKVRRGAQQTEASTRAALGLPTSGPLPHGAFLRTTMIGFKPIQATADQVAAFVLMNVTDKGGEMQPEKTVYSVGILAAVWQDGDWKLSGSVIKNVATQAGPRPSIAAPGDVEFNATGWTAIRQAS